MQIKKIYNNNVLLSENNQQQEMVLMGKGLAFQKKVGDPIDKNLIEKYFILSQHDIESQFSNVIVDIPLEHIDIITDIIELASNKLQIPLNETIYISLLDHLNFAINRYQKNQIIKNSLLWEIKKFYPKEFNIGLAALDYIQQKLQITLLEDEAGFIALHLLNAQQNSHIYNYANKLTSFLQQVLTIVETSYAITLDEKSLNYARFVTHLQFFARRLFQSTQAADAALENLLLPQLTRTYPHAFKCCQKIQSYIAQEFQINIIEDEFVYLMIHLNRITTALPK